MYLYYNVVYIPKCHVKGHALIYLLFVFKVHHYIFISLQGQYNICLINNKDRMEPLPREEKNTNNDTHINGIDYLIFFI